MNSIFIEKIQSKISTFTSSLMVMLDDTRGGLDASSLHRSTSKYKSLAKKIRLLSCHRDTSSTAITKQNKSLEFEILSFLCSLKVWFVFFFYLAIFEHTFIKNNIRNIPVRYILIERFTITKHPSHVFYI